MAYLAELEQRLKRSIRKHKVPGASLAVMRNGKVTAAAAGVVNLDTGVKTTTDSVFQIGSITKPFTATLIMQLVDEGRVNLDAPVAKYLPNFRTARLDVSRSVTIRQFLNHTSGIDGDLFVDTGRGDEATDRFVDQCTMVPSLFEPGEMMSYCNLGFAALGRIIELQRNQSYDQALVDHLYKPLGMKHAVSRPEDTLRFRSAIGHIPDPKKKGQWRVSRVPYLSFGQKAAGATPAMSVTDLMQFARMHMEGGKNRSGDRILKTASIKAMQRPQIKLPRHTRNGINAWGLGWFLMNWQGQKLYGHDGATIGQFAFMRILPAKNMAVALLTNGGDAQGLCQDVLGDVLRHFAKVEEPCLPEPAAKQPDPDLYAGHFENIMNTVDLVSQRGRLTIQSAHKDSGFETYPKNAEVVFVDKSTARPNTGDEVLDRAVLKFSRFDDSGKPQFMQTGFRQYPRI